MTRCRENETEETHVWRAFTYLHPVRCIEYIYCQKVDTKVETVACMYNYMITLSPCRRLSLYGHPLLWIETYKCHRSRTFKMESNTTARACQHTFRAKEKGARWRIHLFQLHAFIESNLYAFCAVHTQCNEHGSNSRGPLTLLPVLRGTHDHHVLIWKLNLRKRGYTFFTHCAIDSVSIEKYRRNNRKIRWFSAAFDVTETWLKIFFFFCLEKPSHPNWCVRNKRWSGTGSNIHVFGYTVHTVYIYGNGKLLSFSRGSC